MSINPKMRLSALSENEDIVMLEEITPETITLVAEPLLAVIHF